MSQPVDTYLSVNATCAAFGISRSTFYRLLEEHRLEEEGVVIRIPPTTGRIRVPSRRFEDWLRGAGRR